MNRFLPGGKFGLRKISESLGLPKLSSYFARHSFANIANNDCGFTIAELGQALNHENREHKITRVYVKENFAIIDKVQKLVIGTINKPFPGLPTPESGLQA